MNGNEHSNNTNNQQEHAPNAASAAPGPNQFSSPEQPYSCVSSLAQGQQASTAKQDEGGPPARPPPHQTPFMTTSSPFHSVLTSGTASNAQAELLASHAVPMAGLPKQEPVLPTLQQSASLPKPLQLEQQQQQQQQHPQPLLSMLGGPALEQQAAEQKLYELQQLQLQLQQQQLLLQQQLLRQKHQDSIQQWGLQDHELPPQRQPTAMSLAFGPAASLAMSQHPALPTGRQPSQGPHALHLENLRLLQSAHQHLPYDGLMPSGTESVLAPGIVGVGGGADPDVHVPHVKGPASATSSSTSVNTSVNNTKAQNLSALYDNASKDAMAMMLKAGGGAHAGGLPPLERTTTQRRRSQAAVRRMHPDNQSKEQHVVQPSRLSMSYHKDPIRADDEGAIARVRRPSVYLQGHGLSSTGARLQADLHHSTSEHPSLGDTQNSGCPPTSLDSLPPITTQQQQQQQQLQSYPSVVGTSARPTIEGSDLPLPLSEPPLTRQPTAAPLSSQGSLLPGPPLPVSTPPQEQPELNVHRGRGMSRAILTRAQSRALSPAASMKSIRQHSPSQAGELPPKAANVEEERTSSGAAAATAAAAAAGNMPADGAGVADANGPKALFADDDDDEAKKNDMLKAFTQKRARWHQIAYWRWFMALLALSLAMLIVGLVLQAIVEKHQESNSESFRWLYFFALVPPLWYSIDISCHYMFKGIEWWLFRESLLYLKNLQNFTVAFILLLLLLLWHMVIFKWLWCEDENRCNAVSYEEAIKILWNLQICFVLFALANLLKSIAAKILSTHFYRTAHFKKLQTAIEKEHFLQVLSRPSTRVRGRKASLDPAQQEDSMAFNTQHAKSGFALARMSNIGNLWRHTRNRSTGAAANPATSDAAVVDAGAAHAAVADGGAQQGAATAVSPPAAPLSAINSAPLPLLKKGLQVVASAVGLTNAPPTLEGGVQDDAQQTALLQDAPTQEMSDNVSGPTGFHLSDSLVHCAGEEPSVSNLLPQSSSATKGTASQPPPPPGLPPPPSSAPPMPQQQQEQDAGPRHPLQTDSLHSREISIQALPLGLEQGRAGPTSPLHQHTYSNTLYNASSLQQAPSLTATASSLGHAYSADPAGPGHWAGHGGVQGGSVGGGPSWYAGDGDDGDFGDSYNSGFSTPLGADRGTPQSEQQQQQQQHVAGSRPAGERRTHTHPQPAAQGSGSGGARGVSFSQLPQEQDREKPHAAPTRGQAFTIGRWGAPDGSNLPAINEPSDSDASDSYSDTEGVASELRRRLRQPSMAGTGILRMATRAPSKAQMDHPQHQTDGPSSPAPNPLGPMGDVMMETVPLASTAKKDLARMTDSELEKVRTAIVIKTYAAIIRNYSNISADEQDAELARVRAFSRALFYNIRGDEDREYVSIEDFDCFFPDDAELALRAFRVFDTDNDNHVTRKEIKEAVVAIYRERATMAASLKDTDSIVQTLEYAIGCLIHFIFFAFYLLIWNVDIVKGFSTFSAMLLAFTFIFGNSVKNMFESMLFLFVEHPYDVGDTVSINTQLYRVKKISLLYTSLVQVNGERIYFPNTYLMTSIISNWTRSKCMTEYVPIQMNVGVPPDILSDIMAALVTHVAAHSTEFEGAPFVQYRQVMELNLKLVVQVSWTYAFALDNWERLVPARNAMVGILQAKLKEHKIIEFTESWRVLNTTMAAHP